VNRLSPARKECSILPPRQEAYSGFTLPPIAVTKIKPAAISWGRLQLAYLINQPNKVMGAHV